MAPRYTPLEMLSRLVSFDTTSRNSNLPLIDFVAGYLDAHGVAYSRVPSDDGAKENLWATVGPPGDGGVVLSGHTDVVPVDGQSWETEPFELTRRGDRVYGRGTTDMKSFSAVALALVPEFAARPLKRPIHIALSYDEEVGCLGAPRLVDHIVQTGQRPMAVIVGEPTSMRVVNAHKAVHVFKTEITGREAHSSATHLGANAIAAAARLMGALAEMGDELRAAGDPSGRFDPPYTTLSVTQIEGGTAVNIIPKSCAFAWDCRLLPTGDIAEIVDRFTRFAEDSVLSDLQRTAPDAAIVTRQVGSIPALLPQPGSDAETLALKLAQKNACEAVSYGTEAGLFQGAEIPTVVCGPGDIAQAHAANEFIEIAEIEACEAFLRRLMDHACTT